MPGVPLEPLTYTDALGVVTDLSTVYGVQYKEGMDGRYMPPVQHISEQVPEQDGERYRLTRALPQVINVVMTFVAADIAGLRTKIRSMARALNPKRGMGKLTVTTHEGFQRTINCIYESGLDGSVNLDTGGDGSAFYQSVVFSFRAFDPYWYDTVAVSKTFRSSVSSSTFFPGTPWALRSSTIFTTFGEDNVGDVEAWPVWTITGPSTNLSITNETTDDEIRLRDIPTATVIIIDTRPGVKTVMTDSGLNLYSSVSGSLFSLLPGNNDIRVEVDSATPETSVNLVYVPRYTSV